MQNDEKKNVFSTVIQQRLNTEWSHLPQWHDNIMVKCNKIFDSPSFQTDPNQYVKTLKSKADFDSEVLTPEWVVLDVLAHYVASKKK